VRVIESHHRVAQIERQRLDPLEVIAPHLVVDRDRGLEGTDGIPGIVHMPPFYRESPAAPNRRAA